MGGVGPYRQGSTSTLSPLAPPFTVHRSSVESGGTLPLHIGSDPYEYGPNPSIANWSQLRTSTSMNSSLSSVEDGIDSAYPRVFPEKNYSYYDARLPMKDSMYGQYSEAFPSNFVDLDPYYSQYPSQIYDNNGLAMASSTHITSEASFCNPDQMNNLSNFGVMDSGLRVQTQTLTYDRDLERRKEVDEILSMKVAKGAIVSANCGTRTHAEKSATDLPVNIESLDSNETYAMGMNKANSQSSYLPKVLSDYSFKSSESSTMNSDRSIPTNISGVSSSQFQMKGWNYFTTETFGQTSLELSDPSHILDPLSNAMNVAHFRSRPTAPTIYYPSIMHSSVRISIPPSGRTSLLNIHKKSNSDGQHLDSCNMEEKACLHTHPRNTKHVDTFSCKMEEASPIKQINDSLDLKFNESSGLSSSNLNLLEIDNGTDLQESFQNSKTHEQDDLAVDSPCWKGTSLTQNFLFGDNEISCHQPHVKGLNEIGDSEKKLGPLAFHITELVSSPKFYQNFAHDENQSGKDCLLSSPEDPVDRSSVCSGGRQEESYSLLLDNIFCDSRATATDVTNLKKEDKNVQPITKVNGTDPSLDIKTSLEDDMCPLSRSTEVLHNSLTKTEVPMEMVREMEASNAFNVNQIGGMDAQIMLKTLHNLSELLLSNSKIYVKPLTESDFMIIQHVVNNLNECMPKKVGSSQMITTNSCPDGSLNSHSTKGVAYPSKDVKRILEENLCEQGEVHPHSLLYKNLWIEAEASLCSLKRDLRLVQMKLNIEECNCKSLKDYKRSTDISEEHKKSEGSDNLGETHELTTEGLEVLSRYDILENKMDSSSNEEKYQQTNLVNAPIEMKDRLSNSIQDVSKKSQSSEILSKKSKNDADNVGNKAEELDIMARFNVLKRGINNLGVSINDPQTKIGVIGSRKLTSNFPSPDSKLDINLNYTPSRIVSYNPPWHIDVKPRESSLLHKNVAGNNSVSIIHENHTNEIGSKMNFSGQLISDLCIHQGSNSNVQSDPSNHENPQKGTIGKQLGLYDNWEHVLNENTKW